MENDKKAREFWIHPEYDEETWQFKDTYANKPIHADFYMHVIEISALTAALKRESDLLEKMGKIERWLDSIKYECEASVYTLTDEEMGGVFTCRDLAYNAIQANKLAREIK